MSPRLRRGIGLIAVPALAFTTLAALPSAPAIAADADPAPLDAGSAWLEDELADGPFSGPFTEGLSIDAVLALDAVGGAPETIDGTVEGLESRMQGPSGYVISTEGGTYESGGSAAKAAVMLQRTGGDPTAYGGLNLVDQLESLISTADGLEGRVIARFNDVDDPSFTNTPIQAFAAEALFRATSPLREEATEYLIRQQCDEGFFRETIPDTSGPQSCDEDPDAAPSVDSTALAVLALEGQGAAVQESLDAAVAWLLEAQKADGSFGSGPDIPTPNSNSTGLAGWALGETGNVTPAERAAGWVRGRQADETAPCHTALSGDQGAIAYDTAALAAGRSDGITVELQDQWRRASAQALPALKWAMDGGEGPISKIDTRGYHQAGTRIRLGAHGFAPGDTVCFRLGSKTVALGVTGNNGQALVRVKLPDGSRTRTYLSNTGDAEGQPLSFKVLDAKTLPVDLKARVGRGGTQVVKVRGLAAREHYKVTYRGKRVDAGKADGNGRAVARFGVGQKTGKVTVVLLGEFKNRRAAKAFTVTR